MTESVNKSEIIGKFKRGEQDTGSPEVQIALLTDRIQNLTRHFGDNAKDNHSRRGMMTLIARRKNLLRYLRSSDVERYRALISALNLRK